MPRLTPSCAQRRVIATLSNGDYFGEELVLRVFNQAKRGSLHRTSSIAAGVTYVRLSRRHRFAHKAHGCANYRLLAQARPQPAACIAWWLIRP